VAASIHARLLAVAQERREDFNLTLQRYAAERFLYRLGASEHREHFILKGATLLALWRGSPYRATKDLDLAGYTDDDPLELVAIMREICAIASAGDGLAFQASSVRADRIRNRSEYRGSRVKIEALLGTARINLQIDVGLGDAVEPPAEVATLPVLLDGPAPRIRAYPREAVIAEKFHAMVDLGATNSRFKDFHDIFELASRFSFEGSLLTRSLAATFQRRRTPVQDDRPIALRSDFYADPKRAAEWQRYLTRIAATGVPPDFDAVGELVRSFLGPLWSALAAGREVAGIWTRAGKWAPPRQ
jgi:predicted nucleotidyltransferase component of viral defense system